MMHRAARLPWVATLLLLVGCCATSAAEADKAAAPTAAPTAEKAASVSADHSRQMAASLELFKTEVRGIFTERCLKCHGGAKTNGELDISSREHLLKGGTQGPAIQPGSSADSLLYRLVSHADEPTMPEEGPKLSDAAIASIGRWIDLGAAFDRPLTSDTDFAKGREITPLQRNFWSFRPLSMPRPPAVRNAAWCRTPVDRFILEKLEAKNLAPQDVIGRRQLLRRAKFDLLGLPPTPEEVAQFVADPAPDAYERLVDRLLADPHYGERWARHWLDLARFAESHGYEQDYDRPTAYHYRDFVIEALNADMPYDRFVKLQIAGDELEPDDPLAMMATGFLGAGVHATQITANQVEKERYDELDDMAATIGTSMLGLTVGCARCHDHKFDPIGQADYYRLLATFTTTVRSEINVNLDPIRYRVAKAEFDRQHAPLVAALGRYERDELPPKFDAWLAARGGAPPRPAPWLVVEPGETKTQSGVKLVPQADGSLLATGPETALDSYDLKFDTPLERITALRLEALPDPSLVAGGPGRGADGNFLLSRIRVKLQPREGSTDQQVARLSAVEATYSQPGHDVAGAVDETEGTSWAVGGRLGQRHAAVFRLAMPLSFAAGTKFSVSLHMGANSPYALGRFRISISTDDSTPPAGADEIRLTAFADARRLLARPTASWTADDRTRVMRWYATLDRPWQQLHQAIAFHELKAPTPTLARALVTSEGLPPLRLNTQGADFFENTYYLKRGDLSQKQGIAPAGFLRVLVRTPEGERTWQSPAPKGSRTSHRRQALATWITDVDRGAGNLLARVIVNRLWQHHFGRGIVSTASDFGSQGERPTHPELLDWLASELVHSGWRLKSLHKLLLTSAAYVQGDATSAAAAAADPDNKLFGRRQRMRLEGEIIRDAMLATSGLLEGRMFGPGSLDDAQRRRSIYFTVKRSHLIPMLTLFDGPDALQGLGQRSSTTVAPQALALMNNTQVQEYARGFGRRLMQAASTSTREAVRQAYEIALSRPPDDRELDEGAAFIEQQYETYATQAAPLELALGDYCQVLMSLNEYVYID